MIRRHYHLSSLVVLFTAFAFISTSSVQASPSGPSIAINFAADESDDITGRSDVTGPAGVFQTANWNNLELLNGSNVPVFGDIDGTVVDNAGTVSWDSANTWTSVGRSEKNNDAPDGDDRRLMSGYLDTNADDPASVQVTISEPAIATAVYDVYVYIKGGVNGRGGDYTIGGETQSHVDIAPFSGEYILGDEGDYLVFEGLTGSSFELIAQPTTGGTRRAPVNAIEIIALEPFVIDGGGQSYIEDFDGMGTTKAMPRGWSGLDAAGGGRISSLGLVDGPLNGAVESAEGLVNVGGNAERFSTTQAGRLETWKDDLDNSGLTDEGDVIADAATDRALGNARVMDDEVGTLTFQINIADNPLSAFVAEWDLEIWGGDPESIFRGEEGGGYTTDLSVGGNSYYSETVSFKPEGLFDTDFDGSAGEPDSTLINGNDHAVRGNSSGIVEVSAADGAVGNIIQWTFDGNHGGADGGWISAIDNVLVRALAAGDAQGDGDVDPADLIQLLAGGAFGQGNIDASWGQGDFDNDGDFDGTDILRVVQGLAGEFPKTYAHDPNNDVPDVLINPATGNITLDTNGITIGSIVMDSAAGIFNGPNSPSWDAPGDFAADIDTQISMPISFTNPGYTGVDDLGDGIIGDLPPGFDILSDLTIKYLDPNGDLLDAEAHVVPEPSSMILATFGVLGLLGYLWRRRRLS